MSEPVVANLYTLHYTQSPPPNAILLDSRSIKLITTKSITLQFNVTNTRMSKSFN